MKLTKILQLLVIFLSLLVPLTQVSAWKNGSYAYHKTEYDYDEDYGTHDWIAEAALEALLDEDESAWTWLNERKEIFLLGTEAPDNSGVETTLDGVVVEGFGDTTKHHVYQDYDTGKVYNNEDDSALRAKSCGDLADANLEENKFDKAAFYLGAMTHYIADLGVYCHVAENNVAPHNTDFDEHHSEYESYVQTRTNDYENKEEFFEIDDVDIDDETKPYDIALDLAWNTFRDEKDGEDAVWMHNNFFTGWVQDYEDRKSDISAHQDYYDRTEESLNNAIEACASAMAYIAGSEAELPGYPIPLMLSISGIAILGIILVEMKRRK